MTLRLVLALVSLTTMLNAAGSAAAAPAHQQLALRLARGEHIVQRTELVDHVDWRLPPQRLESFRSQGMVINEEVRTTILASGVVTAADAGAAQVRGQATMTVRDVPRNTLKVSHAAGVSAITPRNVQLGTSMYAIEDAPMVDLPSSPVALGTRWTTRERVETSLGSGDVVFAHVVAAFDGDRVRIDVTGAGRITGKEYNLPHLLPGTIALHGSAWFDLRSGLLAQESYAIDNTLVKPSKQGEIGFVEHLDADIDTHKEGPALSRMSSFLY